MLDQQGCVRVNLWSFQQYDLHIFEICRNAKKLSEDLATQWLSSYMFAKEKDIPARDKSIKKIVEYFAGHDGHKSL